MSTINTDDLRVTNTRNMVDSLIDSESYVFIGRPTQWETDKTAPMVARNGSGDISPPYPKNNNEDFNTIWDQMLSLKRVMSGQVYYMIYRVTWTSGVVYDMYRHDYTESNRSDSNATNLFDSRFYVINQNREVYVCLDNNKGSQSLVEPLNGGEFPFYTSDGYQWLRIYTLSYNSSASYSTNNYIPITNNEVNYLNPGELSTIVIESPGSEYTTSPAGFSNQVPEYFCKIVGDGRGAVAKVFVENGSIVKARVSRPGIGYTSAKLDFVAGRVYTSIIDLDNEQDGVNPLGNGDFRSTVIIPPAGGWGSPIQPRSSDFVSVGVNFRLARQLGGTRVGIFSTLRYNQSDFVDDVNFRQVGIMQNLEGHSTIDSEGRVVFPESLSATYAVKVNKPLPSENDSYYLGETISQEHVDPVNPAKIRTSMGTVVGWVNGPEYYILRYIQDPKLHIDTTTGEMYRFSGDGVISGDTSFVESVPDIDFAIKGPAELDGVNFNFGYSGPEVRKYSGTLSYVANMTPIQRDMTQTEKITLLISY